MKTGTHLVLYELRLNDQPVCKVETDVPIWWPTRPRLNWAWIRFLLNGVVSSYFSPRS